MASASAFRAGLITVEEFGRRPDPGYPEELVRGEVVAMPVPHGRHGQILSKADRVLGTHVQDHDLGHVLSNHAGVTTRRNPDTVRGADLAFDSDSRLPRGPLPERYGPEVPEPVLKVRPPSDRWPLVQARVAAHPQADVTVVVVLDGDVPTVQGCRPEDRAEVLGLDDTLTLPDMLPGFSVLVRRFFE